jgi:hypothetical protein
VPVSLDDRRHHLTASSNLSFRRQAQKFVTVFDWRRVCCTCMALKRCWCIVHTPNGARAGEGDEALH